MVSATMEKFGVTFVRTLFLHSVLIIYLCSLLSELACVRIISHILSSNIVFIIKLVAIIVFLHLENYCRMLNPTSEVNLLHLLGTWTIICLLIALVNLLAMLNLKALLNSSELSGIP